MKKLIAIVMTLALLCACAYAETGDAFTGRILTGTLPKEAELTRSEENADQVGIIDGFRSTFGKETYAFSESVSRSFFERFVMPSIVTPRCIHEKICAARYFGSPSPERKSSSSGMFIESRSVFSEISVIFSFLIKK